MAEDVRLQALASVIRIYDELTAENGAPTLGIQNQAVDFILANPELRRAVAQWAASINIDEASTVPRRGFPTTSFISRFAPILERSWGSHRDRPLPEPLDKDTVVAVYKRRRDYHRHHRHHYRRRSRRG